MQTPTKILFIAGFGRSGSTLLDRMLGQLPGFFSGGEIKYIWQRGVLENQLCGCGTSFDRCPFWRQVGEQAFGGWQPADARRMVGLSRRVDRHRYLVKLLAPGAFPRFSADVRRYAETTGRLYRAIARVAEARVIVDSSIDPPYGLLLRRAPGLEVRVAHLVRDSRGVAFSWGKRVPRPEIIDRPEFMPTYGPIGCGLRWVGDNLLVAAMEQAGMKRMVIRYEDLVAAPLHQLKRLARHAGERESTTDFASIRSWEVDLGTDHTVAGNPMRFHHGTLQLRLDDAWSHAMPSRTRAAVTLLTWPLLRQYGYVTRRTAQPGNLAAEDVSRP
jgi:hypothetical protein